MNPSIFSLRKSNFKTLRGKNFRFGWSTMKHCTSSVCVSVFALLAVLFSTSLAQKCGKSGCFVALLLSLLRYERICCPHLCFKGISLFKGQKPMPVPRSWRRCLYFSETNCYHVFHPGSIKFGKCLKTDSVTGTVELLAARCCCC